MSYQLIQAMRRFVFQNNTENNTAMNASKMASLGLTALLVALGSIGCTPRDTAVLKKTIRAQKENAGGNVVKANAGNVIDQPAQRSSECRAMNWGDIEIPNEMDQKLAQRSMRAYIVAGNYACYKINAEVQIKKIKEDVAKSRGVLRITKIEFVNRKDLTDFHASLMGMSLSDLNASLDKQNPRNKSVATITYFEVKSLNITPNKPPVSDVKYELVRNVGESLSGCGTQEDVADLIVRPSDYFHAKAFLNSAIQLDKKSCVKVGSQVNLKTFNEEELQRSVNYLESGSVSQLHPQTLELIFGAKIVSRSDEFEMRRMLAAEVDERLGSGASKQAVVIMGLTPILQTTPK